MKTAKLFKRIPSFSGTPVEFDDESGRAINYIDEQLDFQVIGMDSQIGLKFIAGFGPIVDDQAAYRRLYSEDLGIEFDEFEGGYMHAKKIDSCKGFALWPLSMAAEDCFGTRTWPGNISRPQAWLEFDVEDLKAASEEMKKKGHRLLLDTYHEPCRQIVGRFLSPEGILVALTVTPWLREPVNEDHE